MSTKFPVSHLESDGHLVVLVQLFMEAFFLVRFQLDIVGSGKTEEASEGSELGEQHLGREMPYERSNGGMEDR